MKVSFLYREGISFFLIFKIYKIVGRWVITILAPNYFPPPVYPYSIGFTLTWTCVQYCIGVQYSLGVYQYYIERVIKGGLLSVGSPGYGVRWGD